MRNWRTCQDQEIGRESDFESLVSLLPNWNFERISIGLFHSILSQNGHQIEDDKDKQRDAGINEVHSFPTLQTICEI
jgi:hypothetical protein